MCGSSLRLPPLLSAIRYVPLAPCRNGSWRLLLACISLLTFAMSGHAISLPEEQDRIAPLFASKTDAEAEAAARDYPDEAYTEFRKRFLQISAPQREHALFALLRTGNPHILDALDLAMDAEDSNTQGAAVMMLENIAFEQFPLKNAPTTYAHRFVGKLGDSGKAYAAWRRRTAGKAPEVVLTEEETALIDQLANDRDPVVRERAIERLVTGYYKGTTPFDRLRQRVAREHRLLDALERSVDAPGGATVFAMYAFEVFAADEACLRRSVLPLAVASKDLSVREMAIMTLAERKSPMAAEIITRLLTHDMEGLPSYLLFRPITVCSDQKLIPIYLGALEAGAEGMLAKEMVLALARLTRENLFTQTPDDELFIGPRLTEWERWWKRNRDRFPTEVRSIPIPRLKQKLHRDAGGNYYPARLIWREVDNDPQRGYWLACPLRPAEGNGIPPAANQPPGLIVALPEDGDADRCAAFWADVCQKCLTNRYYIAIPAAPQFRRGQKDTWITAKSRPAGPGAILTTERLADDLVRDIESQFAIDPARRFLAGVGASGIPTYSCALVKKTPFNGFLLLNASFQMSKLPSLLPAKGRHFYLQMNTTDTSIPKWQVKTTSQTLARYGAIVKQIDLPGGHDYRSLQDPAQALRDAITWLEDSRSLPRQKPLQ